MRGLFMENNLTTGSVWKTMFAFSLPYLLSYFLQTLYGMADLFIIGQFCKVESTTAVSIGSQVMHMLTLMIVGLSMGSIVVIGQAVGGGKKEQISRSIGNTVTLFMGMSIVITAVLLFLIDPIVHVMSTPLEAVESTASYIMICFLGIPFITAYNIISSILRGMGDSKSPMYFIAIACVSNIALDYLFIGFFHLGPSGAALATTLAQTISVITSLLFLCRQKSDIHLKRSDFKPEKETLCNILKIGIPICLQDGFIQIAFIVITIFANQRGLNDAAAVGIVEKLIGILFLVPSSMLQTVSALCAQNIGAGKHDRAKKILVYASMVTIVWGIFTVLLMHFQSVEIIGMFSNSQEAVQLGVQYMRGYVWDCLVAGIHFCFSGYFCAYGLSQLSFIHNSISIVCVRIPLSYLAAKCFKDSLFPMGLASPAGSLLSVFICVGAYLWMKKRNSYNI